MVKKIFEWNRKVQWYLLIKWIVFVLLWWWKVKSLSHVWLFVTPWTVAYQAPPSMGFSRQEYWSGLSFPSPGDLPNSGIEPRPSAWQVDSLPLSHRGSPPTLSLHTSNTHSKPGHTLHCFWHIHMFSESVPAVTSLHSPVNTLSILQVAFSRSLPGSPQTKGAPSLSES